MRKAVRVVLVGLVALVACGSHVTTSPAPEPPTRAKILERSIGWADTLPLLRFEPPAFYGAVRLAVEQCTGRTRAGWPAFFVAAINPLPGFILAFYDERSKSIVFALGIEASPPTVAHEFIHYLLAPEITSHRLEHETLEDFVLRVHPPEFFGKSGRCAHLLYPGT